MMDHQASLRHKDSNLDNGNQNPVACQLADASLYAAAVGFEPTVTVPSHVRFQGGCLRPLDHTALLRWGTWIRTKTSVSRARRRAISLYPIAQDP